MQPAAQSATRNNIFRASLREALIIIHGVSDLYSALSVIIINGYFRKSQEDLFYLSFNLYC